MFLKVFCLIIGSIVLLGHQSVQAATYYRYIDDNGRKVMVQTLPPEVVSRGYEVLNERGAVVEVVPRALTEEELAAKAAAEAEELARLEQLEKDKKLLEIFSSPLDAERARDRKLEAIDVYIKVTQGNIAKLRDEYNAAQAQAATAERSGREVPDYLVSKMDSFSRQIRKAEESIVEKEQEKISISAEYQEDIDRLKYLMDLKQKASSAE